MKKLGLSIISIALIVLGVALVSERLAYAYADPGNGLLAIQAAGSALVATGWYLRRKIYWILRRNNPKSTHENLPDATDIEDSPNP